MIQMQTFLDVADNTGAKRVQCSKGLGGTHRRYAGLGDLIVASGKMETRSPATWIRNRSSRSRQSASRRSFAMNCLLG